MTISERITDLFSIELPIIQTPLLNVATAKLVAGISNSGGLGMIDASFLNRHQLSNYLEEVRELTNHPFAVNLLVSEREVSDAEVVATAMERIQELYKIAEWEFQPADIETDDSFDDLVTLLIEKEVPIVLFSMGIPDTGIIELLKEAGITIVGHASHMLEALLWQEKGADAILLQGVESGGLSTTFIGNANDVMQPVSTLLAQAQKNLIIPSIMSGGIYCYEQVAAMMIQGADALGVGTAFAMSDESTLDDAIKSLISESNEFDSRLLDDWLGVSARTFINKGSRLMRRAKLNQLTLLSRYRLLEVLEAQLVSDGNDDCLPLLTGLNAQFCETQSVYQLMASLTTKL